MDSSARVTICALAVCLSSLAVSADIVERHRMDGREFDLLLRRNGSPSVLLVSGLGETSVEAWRDVHRRVGEFATVLAYAPKDRDSDASNPAPRDSVEVARELRGLARSLELPPPYVLVGHSSGGFHARVFSALFPEAVSAIVLVDPSHEDFFRSLDELEPGAFEAAISRMDGRRRYRSPLAQREFAAFRAVIVAGDLPSGDPLPDVPVIVITSAQQVAEPRGLVESPEATNLWVRLHRQWAAGVPGATHIVTENSGHYIHAEEPQLVARCVGCVALGCFDLGPACERRGGRAAGELEARSCRETDAGRLPESQGTIVLDPSDLGTSCLDCCRAP